MGAATLINVIGVIAITYNRLTPTVAISFQAQNCKVDSCMAADAYIKHDETQVL